MNTAALRIINETFRGYRRHVVILIALGLIGAVLDGIGINAIVPLISFLLGGGQPSDVISRAIMAFFSIVHVPFSFRYLLAFITILFLLRAVALATSAYVRGYVNAHYMTREMSELFAATMRSRWHFVLSRKSGYIQNTIFWDVTRTSELLDRIVMFVQTVTASLIYLMVALNISWQITLMTLLFGVVLLFVLRRPLISRMRILGSETGVLEKSIAQHVIEYVQGFKQVKAVGALQGVVAEADTYMARLRTVRQKSLFLQGLSGVLLQPIAFLFLIGLFAFSYGAHILNLAAFAATLYLTQKIFSSLDSTQAIFVAGIPLVPYAENLIEYKRLVKENREEEMVDGGPFTLKHGIALQDISLTHMNGTTALSHVSFSIEKGSIVGIIGGSGGGKTSLADLLLRLFTPTSGTLLLDGIDACDIKLTEWRKQVGYVSQDAFLVNASVSHNIRFYDESVTDEDIVRAAKQAHIYEDIMRLPSGFETVVGDRGGTLSGGQRQRIALARALARKPTILVLDEVTSALDSELEAQIRAVISELRGTLTLVVIAHRVSTVLDADTIIVLDHGKVVANDSPSNMLADKESYLSRIIALQGRTAEQRE